MLNSDLHIFIVYNSLTASLWANELFPDAMKPNDPAHYDNDRTRADSKVADMYATFPETVHAGIQQDGEVRSRVSHLEKPHLLIKWASDYCKL